MTKENKQYAWHYYDDGEGYSYFPLESTNLPDAIIEAWEECRSEYGYEYKSIFVGEAVPRKAEDFIPSAGSIIETQAELCHDDWEDGGEWLEGLKPKIVASLQEKISKAWLEWTSEHKLKPTYFMMENVKEYTDSQV